LQLSASLKSAFFIHNTAGPTHVDGQAESAYSVVLFVLVYSGTEWSRWSQHVWCLFCWHFHRHISCTPLCML